ncbi:MAG: PAS domain-containing protein [Alphaproteobacteria bacterium]
MASSYILEATRRINGEMADRCCVIVDMKDPAQSITHVTDGFLEHTGYSRDEVIGQNCRMLQGPDTSPEARAFLHRAIVHGRPATVDILNYAANGKPFWFRVNVAPSFSSEGDLTHFLGVQEPLRKRPDHLMMRYNVEQSAREFPESSMLKVV